MNENDVVVDFESFYSKEVSIKVQGSYHYLRHPEQDIYLVSMRGHNWSYCGSPADAPWEKIHMALALAHNAAFDKLVFERLQELGVVASTIHPTNWQCTANMAAYFGCPRSLQSACKHFLGKDISKDLRTGMLGRRWGDLTEQEQKNMIVYCAQDSEAAWELWCNLSPEWPIEEQIFSQMTVTMCHTGVNVNGNKMEAAITNLHRQMETAMEGIPWLIEGIGKPLSVKAFRAECAHFELTPPGSLAMDSEECEEWLETYGADYPWVNCMRKWRRCNMLSKKLEAMRSRVMKNGRMVYDLKYFGAHTGRDSGGGGVNMQNLHQKELFQTDLRGCVIPAEGHKFLIADLAQIEARVLLWVVKDTKQLDLIAQGMSPYEVHARSSMSWTGGKLKDENAQLYKLAKARVLALGYGAGWKKFHTMAYFPQYLGKDAATVFGESITRMEELEFMEFVSKYEKEEGTKTKLGRDDRFKLEAVNAWLIVKDFREHNPKIPRLWELLGEKIRGDAGQDYHIKLPNGRLLTYREVAINNEDSVTAVISRGDKWVRQKFYGGALTENVVQAVARDVFRDAAIRVAEDYRIVMRVHDELVIEVEDSLVEEAKTHVEELMSITPNWLPGCPVGAEVQTADFYKK